MKIDRVLDLVELQGREQKLAQALAAVQEFKQRDVLYHELLDSIFSATNCSPTVTADYCTWQFGNYQLKIHREMSRPQGKYDAPQPCCSIEYPGDRILIVFDTVSAAYRCQQPVQQFKKDDLVVDWVLSRIEQAFCKHAHITGEKDLTVVPGGLAEKVIDAAVQPKLQQIN